MDDGRKRGIDMTTAADTHTNSLSHTALSMICAQGTQAGSERAGTMCPTLGSVRP